jgi:hypothetical protein
VAPDDPPKPPDWKVPLQLLGATAGLTAFIAFVGASLLWVRFDDLGLPADRAVALLPRELVLVIGAQALAVPVLVALGAVVLIYTIDPFDDQGNPKTRLWVALPVGAALLALVVWLALDVDVWPEGLILVGVLVIALAAILGTAWRGGGFRPVGWVVFAAIVFVGGALAFVRTSFEPKMEPVAALLDEPPGSIVGFYIGEADDRLYIARLPGVLPGSARVSSEPIETVVAIPRDRVLRMALRGPAGLSEADAGREQAQSALEELIAQERPPPADARVAPVATEDPVKTFAPLVHLHSRERIAPTSVDYVRSSSRLVWVHRGGCRDYLPALDRHLDDDDARRVRIPRPVDAARLGNGGYAHTANAKGCRERGRPFKSTEFTRPHGGEGRAQDLLSAREGFALDLENARRRPRPSVTRSSGEAILNPVPVYYERHPVADGERITYWFFYPLSQPPGSERVTRFFVHEGDWERMSVLVRPEPGGRRWTPVSVRYHLHDEHRDIAWTDVRKGPDEDGRQTHPVGFVAVGSHATYHRPGRFENVFDAGGRRLFKVFDDARACPACPRWLTWHSLVHAQGQPWYGFGGAWGQVGADGGLSGPLGPSPHKTEGRSPSPEDVVQQERR